MRGLQALEPQGLERRDVQGLAPALGILCRAWNKKSVEFAFCELEV